MKRILAVALVLTFSLTTYAQDGIAFNKGTWSEILAEAKKEDKLVFVDAFTTWCGPCKWMAANSFPDKAVGDYFNTTFINAKIDMEKGEGKDIAKEYEVRAYPTLLFVNGDGELVHRAVGARDAAGLLALGKTANDPTKQIMAMVKRYEGGDREPAFLRTYAESLSDAGMDAKAVANEYLKTQDNLLTDENMKFIFANTFTTEDAYYGFMVKNKAKFYEALGKEDVDYRIKYAISRPMYRQEDIDFSTVQTAFGEAFDKDDAAKYAAEFKMNYYAYRLRAEGVKEKYLEAAAAYLDNYDVKDQQQLNSIAWTVYENTEDEKYLKKACAWAEKSVKIDSNFYNNDTVAAICYSLGKKRRAKKYAKKAIALGKEEGQDVSATEDLLDKINKM